MAKGVTGFITDTTINQTTKKPTGLKISRNGNTYTFEWQIGDKDYGAGQQLQYKYGNRAWQHFDSSSDIGKTTTKKTLSFPASHFYPTTSIKIDQVVFRVRGKRNDYKDTKKNINYKCLWSEWATKVFNLSKPPKPTISATWDSEHTNWTDFAWSVNKNDTGGSPYHSVAYQKALPTGGASPSYGTKTTSSATSGSWTEKEDSGTINDGYAHKRIVKIWSRSCVGDSDVATAQHIYGAPYQAKNAKAKTKAVTGGYECVVTFNTEVKGIRPIDVINVEYLIAKPAAGFTCPSGASWEQGVSLGYKDGSDTARFNVGDTLDDDECLWTRVNTLHDNHTTPGAPVMARAGKLASPTSVSVQKNHSGSQYTAQITATNASEVPDSFLAIKYQNKKKAKDTFIIGVIPHGASNTLTVNCPEWENSSDVTIGVYAAVGTYSVDQTADGVNIYTIKPFSNGALISDTVWETSLLAPPTVVLDTTMVEGTITARWEWGLKDVTGAEIAWADHDDAWESTDEPDTYEVSRLYAAKWNIAGLDVGKRWYVRIRFYKDTGDAVSYSPWSEMADIMLSSAPDIPSLVLSKSLILQGDELTASWAYTSTDGTPQQCAELCFAQYSNGTTLVYGEPFAFAGNETSITLDTSEWETNQNYLLCVRVRSESQRESGWSSPASVYKARTITCTISSDPFETIQGEDVPCLTDMSEGFTIEVDGAEETDTTTVIVERADSYYLVRPDENEFIGQDGETIILYRQFGNESITIPLDDTNYVVGRLDDGAFYRLIAMVNDDHGQVSKAPEILFRVRWEHQAVMPEATVEIDTENFAAKITPTVGQGALSSDTCDIYRLSADKPELIVQGGTFGETYVDPYPAIGEYGGHRIVCVTANGDYITTTSQGEQVAWVDVEDGLDTTGTIIDFGGEQIHLDRNFDVNHKWSKDFEETVYLGGSIQGDWNPGVSRTASVSTATITLVDAFEIGKMRRLAVYPGICHVRTQDGSSFAADIQVSESRSHSSGGFIATYSLDITRVDTQELDGVLLEEWESEEEEET